VGFEPQGAPDIKYLYYNKEEKVASTEEKEEYKKYSEQKLEQVKLCFENIVKE
jgi:hypothetical protein